MPQGSEGTVMAGGTTRSRRLGVSHTPAVTAARQKPGGFFSSSAAMPKVAMMGETMVSGDSCPWSPEKVTPLLPPSPR